MALAPIRREGLWRKLVALRVTANLCGGRRKLTPTIRDTNFCRFWDKLVRVISWLIFCGNGHKLVFTISATNFCRNQQKITATISTTNFCATVEKLVRLISRTNFCRNQQKIVADITVTNLRVLLLGASTPIERITSHQPYLHRCLRYVRYTMPAAQHRHDLGNDSNAS